MLALPCPKLPIISQKLWGFLPHNFFPSDRHHFGLYRMMSGANYHVSYLQNLETERSLKFSNNLKIFSSHSDSSVSLQDFILSFSSLRQWLQFTSMATTRSVKRIIDSGANQPSIIVSFGAKNSRLDNAEYSSDTSGVVGLKSGPAVYFPKEQDSLCLPSVMHKSLSGHSIQKQWFEDYS